IREDGWDIRFGVAAMDGFARFAGSFAGNDDFACCCDLGSARQIFCRLEEMRIEMSSPVEMVETDAAVAEFWSLPSFGFDRRLLLAPEETMTIGHGEEDIATTITSFMVMALLELIEDHEDEIGPSSTCVWTT
ncbi:hypothetical protein ACLOJK_022395, partial [Asimina triloba]